MDSIIFVFKFIFSVIGAILGFIWDVIVWCFDALAWLIRNIGDLYHWVIRSISDVYHWFIELDMLYQILISVALVVLFGGWAVYSRKRAEEQARQRALLDEERARQRALEKEEEKLQEAIERKCPKCGELNAMWYLETKYGKPFESTKEVTEKTASGREKTRYIKCMRQREEIIWLCEHCGFSRVHEVRTNLLD